MFVCVCAYMRATVVRKCACCDAATSKTTTTSCPSKLSRMFHIQQRDGHDLQVCILDRFVSILCAVRNWDIIVFIEQGGAYEMLVIGWLWCFAGNRPWGNAQWNVLFSFVRQGHCERTDLSMNSYQLIRIASLIVCEQWQIQIVFWLNRLDEMQSG